MRCQRFCTKEILQESSVCLAGNHFAGKAPKIPQAPAPFLFFKKKKHDIQKEKMSLSTQDLFSRVSHFVRSACYPSVQPTKLHLAPIQFLSNRNANITKKISATVVLPPRVLRGDTRLAPPLPN